METMTLYDIMGEIIHLATEGLINGCGPHKQWYLERILETIGVDLTNLKQELKEEGYDWEKGVAP
jgi:hypothetical protein